MDLRYFSNLWRHSGFGFNLCTLNNSSATRKDSFEQLQYTKHASHTQIYIQHTHTHTHTDVYTYKTHTHTSHIYTYKTHTHMHIKRTYSPKHTHTHTYKTHTYTPRKHTHATLAHQGGAGVQGSCMAWRTGWRLTESCWPWGSQMDKTVHWSGRCWTHKSETSNHNH